MVSSLYFRLCSVYQRIGVSAVSSRSGPSTSATFPAKLPITRWPASPQTPPYARKAVWPSESLAGAACAARGERGPQRGRRAAARGERLRARPREDRS